MCQYKVINGNDLQTFVERVNEYTKGDWRPQGSVQVILVGGSTTWYYQALIKD
jgi:hypothetical protein